MPLPLYQFNSPPDIRVLIRDAEGNYLAGDASRWFFTVERAAAAVLNYYADHVPEQLELIRKDHDLNLEAEPVPLEEIYETCDRCKELFMPFMITFDGRQFLCADCARRLAPRASRARRSHPGSQAQAG